MGTSGNSVPDKSRRTGIIARSPFRTQSLKTDMRETSKDGRRAHLPREAHAGAGPQPALKLPWEELAIGLKEGAGENSPAK